MPYSITRHRLTDLLKQLGVAAVYALLIHIEHSHFESDAVIGSFEPASGLALAVLLIFGKRYAGCIFFGALLANTMQAPFMEAAAISSGDTLQALCGSWLLTRNVRFDRALHSLNDYLRLISLGGAISVGIGALITMTALLVSGFATPETYFRELLGWWMGDMLGVILITPLILVCWQEKNDWLGTKRIAETALLLGLTFLVGQIVFLGWFHASLSLLEHVAKGYWIFLCIVWVAVRSGVRGTVIALVMAAIQGLLGAYHGVGFFADDIAQTQLVNYWFYTLTLSVVCMALATYISGQKRSEEALRRSELKFRTLFESTNDAVMLLNEKGFLDCNKATLEMIGCATKEEFCSKHPADLSPPEQPCGTSSVVLANQHIAAAMKEGGRRFEWVCKRADSGRIFIADVLLSAMELEGNLVLQVVIRDVTEQKRAIEEFERFFNLVPDMACIASTDGYFKKINRVWQTTLGYTEQELLSAPFLDFVHPDDRGATIREVERLTAGEHAIQFHNRYRCKDGSYKWLEWDTAPVADSTQLFASARDITARKRAEEALSESENMLRQAQSIARIGHFKFNPASGVVEGSDELFNIFGLSREQFQFSDFVNSVHPDDRDFDMATIKSAIERKIGYEIEHRLLLRDGTLKWVKAVGQFIAASPEERSLLVGTVQDITEYKRAEESLVKNKERLRAYLNNISDTVWVVRENLDIAYVSSGVTRLMGILPEEPIGRPSATYIHPDDMGAIGNATQYLMAHPGEPRTVQYRVKHKDGRWIPVESTGINLLDNPAINGVLVAMRDITERKAIEQQLHDLSAHILDIREQEKSHIAREIHDELGGTLTALKIDTHWLLRKLPVNEETTAFIERAHSMSQRIDNAISTTRHIIDNMRPTILDNLGLLAAIEWQASEFQKSTGIECTVNCIEDEANLDNQRSIALFRILQETLTNVSRHSDASRVKIEFHHSENEAILIVSDNGCGIPENHMAISKSYGSKSYGILGMTERVNQLGGKIIFSSPKGGGFSVEVVLPLPAGDRSAR